MLITLSIYDMCIIKKKNTSICSNSGEIEVERMRVEGEGTELCIAAVFV
jgi:hypothetical protein